MKKTFSFYIKLWILFGFLSGNSLFAQDNPTATQDTLRQQINPNSVSLPDPLSIQSLYTYDPKTNLFYLTKKVGDYNIGYPWVLTPEEYYKRVLKERINKN